MRDVCAFASFGCDAAPLRSRSEARPDRAAAILLLALGAIACGSPATKGRTDAAVEMPLPSMRVELTRPLMQARPMLPSMLAYLTQASMPDMMRASLMPGLTQGR